MHQFLPYNIITRIKNIKKLIINLIIITQGLGERLIYYKIEENSDFNLNYKTIFLNFWHKMVAF